MEPKLFISAIPQQKLYKQLQVNLKHRFSKQHNVYDSHCAKCKWAAKEYHFIFYNQKQLDLTSKHHMWYQCWIILKMASLKLLDSSNTQHVYLDESGNVGND